MGTYTRWRAPFGGVSTPICASTYERTCTWTVSFSVTLRIGAPPIYHVGWL